MGGNKKPILKAITALVAAKDKAESELSDLSLIIKDRDDLVRQLFDNRDAAYRAVADMCNIERLDDSDESVILLTLHADVIAKSKEITP